MGIFIYSMKNHKLPKTSSYWQILPYIREQWLLIAQALACTLGFTIFWPILAQVAGEMAAFIGQGDVRAIAQLAGMTAIIFLIRGVMQYGQNALMAKAALKIALNLRTLAYAHLQRLSLGYFATAKTGDLSYRLTEDIDRIAEVVNKFFHEFTPCILQLIVVLGYMIWLNWQLTLATLVIAPLMALLISWFGEQVLKFSHRASNRISNLSSLLTEVFNGIYLVKAFAAQDYEIQKFSEEAEHHSRAKYRVEQIKSLQFFIVGFLQSLSVLLLFFLGGWQIDRGNLTGNGFVSYVVATAMLIDPISFATSNYNDFKQTEASVDRIFALLAVAPTVREKPNAIVLSAVKGKVEYRHVSFGYQPGLSVLRNLSLAASPGEAIALVGASGAGKTTLVNLLPRFYDLSDGQICIDGINIAEVALSSLRRQIGIVPQETILFSGTIAANIAFGQTEFDMAEVQAAAKIANAHQFITQLPEGYNSWMGERGMNLSGGQRQRIAIARAIMRNPRILILDEATSALDAESEALVQQALERIMADRTVFIIAHRLATVRRASRILVMEDGQIVEMGTHSELLAQGTRYAHFYARQFH